MWAIETKIGQQEPSKSPLYCPWLYSLSSYSGKPRLTIILIVFFNSAQRIRAKPRVRLSTRDTRATMTASMETKAQDVTPITWAGGRLSLSQLKRAVSLRILFSLVAVYGLVADRKSVHN